MCLDCADCLQVFEGLTWPEAFKLYRMRTICALQGMILSFCKLIKIVIDLNGIRNKLLLVFVVSYERRTHCDNRVQMPHLCIRICFPHIMKCTTVAYAIS